MKNQTKKTRMPNYMKSFRCIGSACEDNCCIGWDVDIDKKTYLKYGKVNDSELKQLFDKNIHRNKQCFNDNIDYATVKLSKQKRCPFLNDVQLCRIQAKLSEGFLSNVCATFPRYTHVVDGVREQSATVSCPEIARLILLNPEPIVYREETIRADERLIVTHTIDTRDSREKNPLVSHLPELRKFTIEILQDRTRSLEERMTILAKFFSALQKRIQTGRNPNPSAWILQTQKELLAEAPTTQPTDWTFQAERFREMLLALDMLKTIDSKRYVDAARTVLSGFGYSDSLSTKDLGLRMAEGHRLHMKHFMKKHGYMLENYLVNAVYRNLFPAADSNQAFDVYMILALSFTLIRMQLTGLALAQNGLKPEDAAMYIQSFAKVAEHHKTFWDAMALNMRRKQYSTLSGATKLLAVE